jgi:predicted phosphodiesterase
MRYAIVSDIHANWQAWSVVLADIREHKADVIICLGDVVGYGPRPEEVLSSVRQHTQNFVIGNHDAAACGQLDASIFNDHARSVVEWTTQHLSHNSLAFLREIPLTLETEDILFVHAEIQNPDRFGYIESDEEALQQLMFTGANIVFIGHTHKPLAYSFNSERIQTLPDTDFHLAPGHRYLVNVGSVGEPRDSNEIRARYVLYDSNRRAVYFRKVKFDVEAYRKDLQTVGLNIRPFFLSILDHEASQGRDLLAEMPEHMMTVPEVPLFTGNKTAAQTIVVGNDSNSEAYVPFPRAEPATTPVKDTPVLRTTQPGTPSRTTAPVPKPAEPKNHFGFVLFLLAVILISFTIALLIIFR